MIDSHSVYASNGVTHGEQPGCFTLTNIDSNSQATITLDYGHCSGGIPVLVVDTASSQDLLQLQIVYSETAQGIGSETGELVQQPQSSHTLTFQATDLFSSFQMLWIATEVLL